MGSRQGEQVRGNILIFSGSGAKLVLCLSFFFSFLSYLFLENIRILEYRERKQAHQPPALPVASAHFLIPVSPVSPVMVFKKIEKEEKKKEEKIFIFTFLLKE